VPLGSVRAVIADGGGHACALVELVALGGELGLEGEEEGEYVLLRRSVAHEADAQDLALEDADTASDLDVVVLEEALAQPPPGQDVTLRDPSLRR